VRDPDPYPVPVKVRTCRVAGCMRTDLWRPLDVFCREHTDLVMRFRRFLDGSMEFSGDPDIVGTQNRDGSHFSPAGPSFDAVRALWERARRDPGTTSSGM
jgi:hypothetical protein